MNSSFLHHEKCPDCAAAGRDTAGDNLAVYDDGHKFCFACGYYEGIQFTPSPARAKEEENTRKSLKLPEDAVNSLPLEAKFWLGKYGITEGEASKNNFRWSQSKGMLIMPVFDPYGNLLLWQGRVFDERAKSGMKYYTKGEPEKVLNIIGEQKDTVVLVEDVLSAIKVGRVNAAMPLYGSNIGNERILRIASEFSNLILWLDRDKADYSIKARQRYLPYFDNIGTVIKPLDPKEYKTNEIKTFLDNFSWR